MVAGGWALSTVTLTAVDVVVSPAVSRAVAVSTCAPSELVLVSQFVRNGGAVTGWPICVPSTKKVTSAIPVPLAACAYSVTVDDTVEPSAGPVICTEGGAVPPFATVTATTGEVPMTPVGPVV